MLIISNKKDYNDYYFIWVFWYANIANLFQELPVFRVKSLLRSIKPISTQPLTIKTNTFNDFISNLICFLFIQYKSFLDSNHYKLKIITTEQEWNCLHLLINPLNWLKKLMSLPAPLCYPCTAFQSEQSEALTSLLWRHKKLVEYKSFPASKCVISITSFIILTYFLWALNLYFWQSFRVIILPSCGGPILCYFSIDVLIFSPA